MLLLKESMTVLMRLPSLQKSYIKLSWISWLRDTFLKTKLITDRKNCTVQRSYCKKLLRSTKKSCFNKLDISKINDSISFWKTTVSFFKKKKASKNVKLNLEKVKMSQTMPNFVAFLIIISQKSFSI